MYDTLYIHYHVLICNQFAMSSCKKELSSLLAICHKHTFTFITKLYEAHL